MFRVQSSDNIRYTCNDNMGNYLPSPWWRAAVNARRSDDAAICFIFWENVRMFIASATLSPKICAMYSIWVGAITYTSLVMSDVLNLCTGSRIIDIPPVPIYFTPVLYTILW